MISTESTLRVSPNEFADLLHTTIPKLEKNLKDIEGIDPQNDYEAEFVLHITLGLWIHRAQRLLKNFDKYSYGDCVCYGKAFEIADKKIDEFMKKYGLTHP
ncbi:TPA: hypothetical protein QH074_004289 [Enterobacter hormaechei subsp. steigerwaltii]|nr:hypothetical protein [Enterobacter hormaechei subsp. steigerwaltii]